MNKTALVLGLAITLAGACGAFAGEKKAKPRAVAKSKVAPSRQTDEVSTGSHLKQKVRRNGRITDGASQVLVIDQTAIQRSGASDLKQLLVRYGANR